MAQILKQSHNKGGGKKSICWELHISLQDIYSQIPLAV